MAKQKIDRKRLHDMLKQGKTQRECAAYFKTSEVAIWKAKKELNLAVVKNVTMEAGHRIVEGHLDTVSQLQAINEKTNLILDGLMEEISKGGPTRETGKLREIALKASQEIRGQLAFQLDLFQSLYNMASVSEFQREVLTVIGKANECPECGAEIFCKACGAKINLRSQAINRLKEARALRSGVEFKP